MSEYQYYEFLAVDHPLREAEQQALRELSTRARITATSFSNSYEWGTFKGDPAALMQRWFDLHLYDAITLSTAPGSGSRHWRQAIAFLDRDRPVRRGEMIRLTVGHTDSHFFFRWPTS